MNTTRVSQEIEMDEYGMDKQGSEVSTMEKDLNTMKSAVTVSSLLNEPLGEGTGPTSDVDSRENPVGRVPSHGERDIFERAVSQRAAICFPAGVIGAAAVVLFSHALFRLGISATLGVEAPVSLKSPDIYRPLFWGGLWGILFGLFIKRAWNRLYLAGFLYVLAPLLALFLFFLPMSGAGYFGLHRGSAFTVYLVVVNLPFGIVTALAAGAILGKHP